jgi:hypothetical protein
MLPPARIGQPEHTAPSPADLPLVTIGVFCSQAADLPDTLTSLAEQTYPHLEVLVIDDGFTHQESGIFEAMRSRHPRFRFLRQDSGSPTRDCGLWGAQGSYFIPMEAGILACADMVERFVAAMRGNPDLSAMTCYVSSFRRLPMDSSREESCLLASPKNLSSSGIFKVADLRNVGGYGIDLRLPGQDWLAFFNLVNAGYRVDILPEHLFYYRPPDDCSGRTPIHRFVEADRFLAAERVALWRALTGAQQRLEQMQQRLNKVTEQNQLLESRCASLRYQAADRLALLWARVPFSKRIIRWLLSRAP